MGHWGQKAILQLQTWALALLAGSMLTSCGSLPDYSELRLGEPGSEFARLENQWVHFERMGSGEPLVLLHGFGESTYTWRQVMPALAEHYDVIAIDLNGFGLTERPLAASAYTLDGQVALVLRVLDHLGIDDFTLVGHSYGTAVAFRMENTHGDRIRELVFVDGAPGDSEDPELAAPAPARIFEPFLRCYVEHVLLTPAEVRNLLAGATVQHAFLTDEVVNEYLRRLRVEGLDRTIAGLFTVLGAQPVVPDFSSVTQRTLVLWGDQDSVFTLDSANRLVDRLPNAKLVVLENSGHIPMEEVPDAFTNALLEFLGGG